MVEMKTKDKTKQTKAKLHSSKPLLNQAHLKKKLGAIPSQPVYTETASDMNASFTPSSYKEDKGLRTETLRWSTWCTEWQKDQIPLFPNRSWVVLLDKS